MNSLQVILKNAISKPDIIEFSDFNFKYSKYKIYYFYDYPGVKIRIEGKASFEVLYKIFMLQYELLFLNFGYFFPIAEYKENNMMSRIENYMDVKYIYSQDVYIDNFQIASIPLLINNNTLTEYSKLKVKFGRALRALFYIKSELYANLLVDHQFTIITQICDGYENLVQDSEWTSIKKAQEPYIDLLTSINKKYKLGIYKRLRTNKKSLLDRIVDTRNQYSHYIDKPKSIDKNELFPIYFRISELLLRVNICKGLGVTYEISTVENISAIGDWATDINKVPLPHKSQRYLQYDALNKLNSITNFEEVSNERN